MSFNEIFPNYPKGWRSLTLGELAKENGGSIQTGPFGSQLHASDYVECGIPSIMPKNISVDGVLKNDIAQIKPEDAERLAKYRVRLGDIVYSRRGDVEKCCLITKKEDGWLCGTGCLRVRISADNILQQYIHAYLCHPSVRNWVVRHAIGATMPNLNTSILSALPVLIPTTKEMQLIVGIWSTVSKKITLNTQINQTLEQMAQALFKSWFVDFDPVIDNALEADNPIPEPLAERAARRQAMWAAQDEAAPVRLPDETRQLLPDRFEEDDVLGWVPVGWQSKPLSQQIMLIGGGTPKRSDKSFWGGDIPWFSVKDAPSESDVFVLDTEDKITGAGLEGSSARLLPAGTTIISARGTVGKLAITGVEMAMNQSCYGVRPVEGLGDYYNFYNVKNAVVGLQQNVHGAVFDTITRQTFETVSSPLPNESVVAEFESRVAVFMSKIKAALEENIPLTQLRDTLLPKLLSSELTFDTVEDAKREAEEVMA